MEFSDVGNVAVKKRRRISSCAIDGISILGEVWKKKKIEPNGVKLLLILGQQWKIHHSYIRNDWLIRVYGGGKGLWDVGI